MDAAATRTVLHVDLDAFYASVEQRDDPALRGRPVIVGGHSRRGVVCAASYEARPFGVRSAMPMARALALCPHAVVLPPRMEHYAAVSGLFFEVLGRFTPLVEGLSLDEAFLDVTAERTLLGDGPAIARAIKTAVRSELALVASVGVAPNKFVAKVASDLGKPDGLLVVDAREVAAFLDPLPVSRLWGVGRITEARLAEAGLTTIAAVRTCPPARLSALLGPGLAEHLAALARGFDERAVNPEREAVSIGHEETFAVDCRERALLAQELLRQADRVAERLRAHGLRARTVTVKVKYGNHRLVTRRATLAQATADGQQMGAVATELLARVPDIETRGVRLTGVSASGFASVEDAPEGQGRQAAQLALPLAKPGSSTPASAQASGARERGERLGATLDQIKAKFGRAAIGRATHLDDDGAFD